MRASPFWTSMQQLITLKLRQNGRHFPDDIFKCIFFNENVWIAIKISLMFVPNGPINIIPALVQIMAWRCPGNKPLPEPMMVNLPTQICVTRPQWVKQLKINLIFPVLPYSIGPTCAVYIVSLPVNRHDSFERTKINRPCIMTSSNENIFRVTGLLCGEFIGPRWIVPQRPVTWSFDVFFDLGLNKQLIKQWRRWWFETPLRSLRRHRNGLPQMSLARIGPQIPVGW